MVAAMTKDVRPDPPADEEGLTNDATLTRREVLHAVKKYSSIIAGSATVVLTADEALAKAACSRIGGPNGGGPPPFGGPPWCRPPRR